MKKNSISIVFILLLMTASLIPSVGLLLFGAGESSGNEKKAELPALVKDGSLNIGVLDEYKEYIAQNFFLREEAVTGWARLSAGLGQASNDQLTLGADGWLYYRETLDDYRGIGLPEDQLLEIARNLSLAQQSAAQHGASFLFAVAPNKISLYDGEAPAYLINAHDSSNAARLQPLLDKAGVGTVDLFDTFSKEEETLYYRTDSHWTVKGAALGADTVMAAFGRPTQYFSQDFSVPGTHRGDLYDMLYPRGRLEEEEPLSSRVFSYNTLGNARGGEAVTIRTANDSADGKLFCLRDSFGNALYPYLAESFGSATFSRSDRYDLLRSEAQEADFVLFEIVERNIDWLWEKPMLFPALSRPVPAAEQSELKLKASAEVYDETAQIVTVELPTALRTPGSPVYLVADGQAYESPVNADPASEESVRLTACVPQEAEVMGLIVELDGRTVFYPSTVE